MEKISVIVPCYDEEKNIVPYYNEMKKCFKNTKVELELIFVDDGSKDNTLSIIKSLKNDSSVKYLSFSRNFGKEAAMYAGLFYSTGDYVAIMDVDMQDPPSLLIKMINLIKEFDYDIIGSRRVTREGEPIIRSFFARIFYKSINRITKLNIVDGTRDFRLMKRQVVDSVLKMKEYNRFSKGLFNFVGYKVKWLEYENVKRVNGESKWSFWNLFIYAIEGLVSFSSIPLMLSCFFGIFLILISIIISIVFVLLKKELLYHFIWFIMLNTGIILSFCGIIGIYISKIHLEVKQRPIYLVKEMSFDEKK